MIPILCAFGVAHFFVRRGITEKYALAVVYVPLLISAVINSYVIYHLNLSFPWETDIFSVFLFVLGFIISFLAIGSLGVWYTIAVFIQEVVILSMTFLLLTVFPVYVVILLIVPVFVLAHFTSLNHWIVRVVLLSLWGVASVLLFATTQNIYIIVALHSILGSFLYLRTGYSIWQDRKDLLQS
jgi:hypothetical protein